MKKYYPSIQILRGFLFILICAFHCGVPFTDLCWGGIEAFFVISAFFLVKKYYGNNELSVKKQFMHRICRLYPPYIVVLIIATLYALLAKQVPFDFIIHLLSGQNFMWMKTGYLSSMKPMTAHTWTLSIEVYTGLVWILLLRFLNKKQFKIIMYGMIILGILYRTLTIIQGCNVYVISLCPLAHFDAFALGSLLAILSINEKLNSKIGILCVPGVLGIIACIYVIAIKNKVSILQGYLLLSSPTNYLNHYFTGNIYIFISLFITGFVGLLYLYDIRRENNHGKIYNYFVSLGNNSYVFYLFHWPIRMVVYRVVKLWYIAFPLILLVTIVATFIFEKIYIKIRSKIRSIEA